MERLGPASATAVDHPTRLEGLPADDVDRAVHVLEGEHRSIVLVRHLVARRRFLFRITAIGALLTLVGALLMSNRYQATARLMPPDNPPASPLAMLSQLSAGGLGSVGQLLGTNTSGSLFVGVMRSRTVEDRLIARFDLKKRYRTRLSESARSILEANTAISEDSKSGIISVAVTAKDPRLAASLANAYVEELDHLVTQLTTSAAHRERVFIEERLKVVKQELEQAEQQFSQFASKNTAVDIQQQGRAMLDAVARLQGELIATESELRGLEQIYTENNVRVRAAKARVAELRTQLNKLGGSPGGGSAASDTNQSGYPTIRALPLLGVTYADLYRRTKVQETVYETLTKQYELAKVEEAKEIPTVRVLDVAEAPERKIGPHRLSILLFGTCFSFALGVLWVLGQSRWQEIEPGDPRKIIAGHVFRAASSRVPERVRRNRILRKLRRSDTGDASDSMID